MAGWYQQVCGALAALVVLPMVVKTLNAASAGLWFSFQSVLLIINLTDFGLSFVVARQVAYSLHTRSGEVSPNSDFVPTREGWKGVSDVYHASRRLFRWGGWVAAAILVLLYHLILPLGKLLTQSSFETLLAWYLLGAATLLSLQTKPHLALVEGTSKLYLTRFLGGTIQLLAGIGIITVLLLGGQLVEMAMVVCATSLLQYVGAKYLVAREVNDRLSSGDRLPTGLEGKFLKVAIPMGILNLSSFLFSSIQVPLLGFLLGPEVVPGFFLAQRIGQMLNQAVMQLVSPQMPLFTLELAKADRVAAGNRMQRTIRLVTTLAFLVNAGFFWGSPLLVELWVGPGRYIGSLVLLVMAVDYFLMSFTVVWAQFVFAAGSNPFVWSTLLSAVLNVLLILLLVPRFSLTGAALASLIAGSSINYWFVGWKGFCRLRELKAAACIP